MMVALVHAVALLPREAHLISKVWGSFAGGASPTLFAGNAHRSGTSLPKKGLEALERQHRVTKDEGQLIELCPLQEKHPCCHLPSHPTHVQLGARGRARLPRPGHPTPASFSLQTPVCVRWGE